MAERQRFTKAFKVETIRLWKSSGRPAAAVARELGLRRNHLYKWQTELEAHGETNDLKLFYPVDPKQLPRELDGVVWPPKS